MTITIGFAVRAAIAFSTILFAAVAPVCIAIGFIAIPVAVRVVVVSSSVALVCGGVA